jgi:hypothetical protein
MFLGIRHCTELHCQLNLFLNILSNLNRFIIKLNCLKGVIGAHISLQNGTDLAQVFNPYVEIAGKSEIPTGEVNGQLSKGVLTTRDLSGTLEGKNVTDLTNLMNTGSVYVIVRTQANENGEIQGQVTPSNTTGK